MARKQKVNHVVMWRGGFLCENCGRTYEVHYPIEPYMFSAQATAFTKEHSKCLKTWTHPVPDPNTTIAERMSFWLEQGERGVSSETIFACLGKGTSHSFPTAVFTFRHKTNWHHPLDPDDFKRCHKLLEVIPEWRSRLDELKTIGDPWPALVDNWDRLTEMFLEQLKTKKPNGMYQFMKDLGC